MCDPPNFIIYIFIYIHICNYVIFHIFWSKSQDNVFFVYGIGRKPQPLFASRPLCCCDTWTATTSASWSIPKTNFGHGWYQYDIYGDIYGKYMGISLFPKKTMGNIWGYDIFKTWRQTWFIFILHQRTQLAAGPRYLFLNSPYSDYVYIKR
jgi:hypothetical protein